VPRHCVGTPSQGAYLAFRFKERRGEEGIRSIMAAVHAIIQAACLVIEKTGAALKRNGPELRRIGRAFERR
jgi:hypothetical protein